MKDLYLLENIEIANDEFGTPSLLDIELQGHDVYLRVDQNSFHSADFKELPVKLVILRGCTQAAQLYEYLVPRIGCTIEFTKAMEDDRFTGELYINYLSDEFPFSCTGFEESSAQYSQIDLERKCNRLSLLLKANCRNREGEIRKLKSELNGSYELHRFASKELESCVRKRDFLKSHPAREGIEKLDAKISMLNKLLSSKDNNPIERSDKSPAH